MKTTILADGTLSITPESDLDAFALDQWVRANLGAVPSAMRPKMIVDLSAYAEAIGLSIQLNEFGGIRQF